MSASLIGAMSASLIGTRAVAACLLVAHAGLALDLLPMAGQDGVRSCALNVAATERDFEPQVFWRYFPSILYLTGTSDTALTLLSATGCIAAMAAAFAPSRYWILRAAGLAISNVALASFGICESLWINTPWDCMLIEASGVEVLASLPLPGDLGVELTGWLRRWLLFRVLVGFAKHRFISISECTLSWIWGGWWPHVACEHISWVCPMPGSLEGAIDLRNFLLLLPMTHRLGWLATALVPLPAFRVAHCFYVAVEVLAPPCFLLPDCLARRAAAWCTVLLMLGIIAGANFGFFNAVTIALCLPLTRSTASDAVRSDGGGAPPSTMLFKTPMTGGQRRLGRLRRRAKCWCILRVACWALAGFYTALSLVFILPSEWASPAVFWWGGADGTLGTAPATHARAWEPHAWESHACTHAHTRVCTRAHTHVCTHVHLRTPSHARTLGFVACFRSLVSQGSACLLPAPSTYATAPPIRIPLFTLPPSCSYHPHPIHTTSIHGAHTCLQASGWPRSAVWPPAGGSSTRTASFRPRTAADPTRTSAS